MSKFTQVLVTLAQMEQGEHEVRKALDCLRAARVHFDQADYQWGVIEIDETVTKMERLT